MHRRYYLLILIHWSWLAFIHCQSGMLDTAFGDEGIVITDIDRSDYISDMVIQTDQKLLVAGNIGGELGIGGLNDIVVIRYLPDGSFDQDFGIGGAMHVYPGEDFQFFSCGAMALQADGRIILAGNVSYVSEITFEYVEDIVLVRLNTNGFIDSTFGNEGIVITDFGGDMENAHCLLVQVDGKIIVAGTSQEESPLGSGFIITRYESNGAKDVSFGEEGFVKTFIQKNSIPYSGAIQPDGKIILAGVTSNSFLTGDFAMVRYLENGTMDNSFGSGGIVQTDLQSNNFNNIPLTIVLDPDGKITLGGYADLTSIPHMSHMGIVRYTTDGNLDESFGNNGIFELALGTKSHVTSMARQPNGKYLLSGSSNIIDSTETWLLARLDHQGKLDSTFGNQGFITTDLEGEIEFGTKVLIQNDSRILVAGFNNGGPNTYRDFVVARYFADFIVESYTAGEIICPEDSTGKVGVEVSGGQPPYLFSIDGQNYQSESFFDGLAPGEYFIHITDSQNPPSDATIGPLTILDVSVSTGAVEVISNTIIVSSDKNDFLLYSLNGIDFQTDSVFTAVPEGIYTVIVITTVGCTILLDTVAITMIGTQTVKPSMVSGYPNPCSDYFLLEVLNTEGPLRCLISNYLGQVIMNKVIYADADAKYLIDTQSLASGLYQLSVKSNYHSTLLSFVVSH